MNRGGFSWKRATGVTRAKQRISRRTGVPLTRSGRQRKVGRMVTGGGCLLPTLLLAALLLAACGGASSTGSPGYQAPAATGPSATRGIGVAPDVAATAKPAAPAKATPRPKATAAPYADAKAAGATAVCADGTWSYSAHRSGTCSGHGGVHWWTGKVGAEGPGAH